MYYFTLIIFFLSALSTVFAEDVIDPDRAANTVILDKTAIQNLKVETVSVTERTFESTVFAIGRIEAIPASQSVLSSRISGRVIGLEVFVGDTIKQGQVLARIESRQPGDPPPIIELKAPQGGLVIESHVRVGEPVEPDKELLDISDRTRVWAVARIPEQEASGIVPGTKARIKVPALGDTLVEATLIRYGVEANREVGAVDGIFELDNGDGRLQPGMRVEFSIITKLRNDVMAVPRAAIQGDPTKRVVFVKDFELENAFVRVPVVLGEQNERFIEVVSGLFPGDDVVTRGSYALSFAGGGSGMSLKDALDAAHGHEHNEDGSEKAEEQTSAEESAQKGPAELSLGGYFGSLGILIWAGVATLVALVLAQSLWRVKRAASSQSES